MTPDRPVSQSEASCEKRQGAKLESIASVRKRPYKRVPSALTPAQRLQAVQSLQAGRNVHQVACELSCAPWVVMELWVRAEFRRAA
jgi:hypothetical protein